MHDEFGIYCRDKLPKDNVEGEIHEDEDDHSFTAYFPHSGKSPLRIGPLT